MVKRKISKASKRRLSILAPLSIVAILYCFICFIYNIYTIYDLKKEKKSLDVLYVKLQEKNEELKNDIEKLNDEDYLANYARENYLYSKDGEYILKLGEEISDAKEEIDDNLNKNYIILALSFVMFLVFVYITIKGKRAPRKNKK